MEFGRPEPLSGKYEGSFAYLTIRDRLPVILTKVIDAVHRRATAFVRAGNKELAEDATGIVARLSKLRYEMKTDKKLTLVEDGRHDADSWNKFLQSAKDIIDVEQLSWFCGAWLTCECFMYRKIYEAFALSSSHQQFDAFEDQKQRSYTAMESSVTPLAQYVVDCIDNKTSPQENITKLHFETFLQFSLWGNKCDLSISSGEVHVETQQQEAGLVSQMENLKNRILVDHTQHVWQKLSDSDLREATRIDFVLDNAGFELFTDLCLAEFIIHSNLAKCVHLHLKEIPWFVSDSLRKDLLWMFGQMKISENKAVSHLGHKWLSRIEDGSFVTREHEFWSLPHDYSQMKTQDLELYKDLSKAKLVFFKGDLNYRKLVGDCKWPHTTPFEEALWGFHPAPICALRTLKADVQVGLLPGQDTQLEKQEKDWMVNGSYAVIQYANNL